MNKFINRQKLAGWYISIIISFFVFNLAKELIVNVFSDWTASVLIIILNNNLSDTFISWAALFIVCLAIVWLVEWTVVEALNFLPDNEDYSWLSLGVLFALTLGSFLYILNSVFDQPMPQEIFPDMLAKFLGGNSTNSSSFPDSVEDNNVLTLSPWLWTLGPLVFIWIKTIASKFETSPAPSKSGDTIKHEMSFKA
ncbi:MAG: hypothetical protein AAGF07_04915 [Patescibacteria group bacterium]